MTAAKESTVGTEAGFERRRFGLWALKCCTVTLILSETKESLFSDVIVMDHVMILPEIV